MLIRKESKLLWAFVSEPSAQGLGSGCKLVKVLQDLLIHAFSTLISLVIGYLSVLGEREGTCHGDLFLAFKGTEVSQRALPGSCCFSADFSAK